MRPGRRLVCREGRLTAERTLHVAKSTGEKLPPQTPRPPSTNKVGRGGGLGPGLFADLTPAERRRKQERQVTGSACGGGLGFLFGMQAGMRQVGGIK